MNVTAESTKDITDIYNNILRQNYEPVRWEQTIRNMIDDGYEVFIECGPGTTLSTFIKRINPDIKILNVNSVRTLDETIKYVEEL